MCFVIDSSGSIRDSNPPDGSRDNWRTILTFVNDIINVFTIGEQDTRVGMVRFSNNALFTFPLTEYSEESMLRQAVLGIQYIGGTTNTAEALQLTANECFNTNNGDRPDVDNLAIIITDGLPTVFDLDLATEAAALKRKATVIAVGITDNVEEDLLRDISSPPQELNQNYFTAPDFTSLDTILRALIFETCKTPGASPAPVPPPTRVPPPPQPSPDPGKIFFNIESQVAVHNLRNIKQAKSAFQMRNSVQFLPDSSMIKICKILYIYCSRKVLVLYKALCCCLSTPTTVLKLDISIVY